MKLIPASPQLQHLFISVGSTGRQSVGTSDYRFGPEYVEPCLVEESTMSTNKEK